MYPFAIINSFGSKIERVYRDFAQRVNNEIFPAIRRDVARYVSTDGIIQDAANVLELLEEIRLNYGDYVDDVLLTKIIAENMNLLDGWSTSQLNAMLEKQNIAMGVGVIGKDGSRPVPTTVPLIPRSNVVSMANIPLANNSQRLLQNDAYSKYFFDVEEIINNGIIDGLNADEITKQILDKVDMNAKRARFWAEDQASIFQAEQTRLKAQREGYTHYRWKCQGNARPSHAVHRDQIYSWNVGVNNLTRPGARHPGEDYRCHCSPEIVTPEEIAKAGVGNPGPRTPQSTSGLMENYSGSEAVKAEKGKAFREAMNSTINVAQTLAANFGNPISASDWSAISQADKTKQSKIVNQISTLDNATIETVNPLIKKSPLEIAVVFDEKGVMQTISKGIKDKVYIDIPTSEKLIGYSVTHNHVLDLPPSLTDMQFSISNQLSRLVVQSPKSVYEVSGIPKSLTIEMFTDYYEKMIVKAKSFYVNDYINGKLTKLQFDSKVRSLALRECASNFKFKFTKDGL